MTIFHFTHRDDLYEVALDELRITRISRYSGGTNHRTDLNYDDLPQQVKDTILDKIEEKLLKNY